MLTPRASRRTTLLLAYAAMLLVAAVGCQLVAGLQSRTLDPIGVGCSLPSGPGPRVRVANLAPTGDLVDVCLRLAGAPSWGRPVLLDGGTTDAGLQPGCATSAYLGAPGFAYGQVSVAFSAPATTVDVKMIPGGTTCDSPALGEGDGLTLATSAVTTLALIGAAGVAETVVALPESDSANPTDLRVRFVHAMPGTGPLDFGITAGKSLPTTVGSSVLDQPIPFGSTAPSGTTTSVPNATLEDNGYFSILAAAFYLGAKVDGGSDKALLVEPFTQTNAATFSLYAIGVAGDNAHPLRGLVCDEDVNAPPGPSPLLLPCTGTPLPSISVDMWNPALYGSNAPYITARTPLVPQAIAGRTGTDIVCLAEVDNQPDRDAIVAATAGTLPNVYSPTTSLTTPITNPADQSGQVPPPPTGPPCAGVDPGLIDTAIGCVEMSCSNEGPGNAAGQLDQTTSCVSGNCAEQFIDIESTQPDGACFDCLIDYIATDELFSTVQSECTTDSTPPLAYLGQENSMILSKYPLLNTDVLVLPSTLYRRSVLYAQVQLEDQTVDFYCGFLISTLIAADLPYDGNYGGSYLSDAGVDDSTLGWDSEQLLQAQQLVAWVQSKSKGRPAIVVGEWRSSLADTGHGVGALNPQTMQLLQGSAGWTAAVPGPTSGSAWVPQCSYCPTSINPYNGPTASYFVSQPFLVGWPDPTNAMKDESLVFTGNTVPLAGDAGAGPLSPYYGVNISVLRPVQ
jgi:hypothetical protein